MDKLRQRLRQQGFTLVHGKKHQKVLRDGKMVGILPHGVKMSSNSYRNILASLKRVGYKDQ